MKLFSLLFVGIFGAPNCDSWICPMSIEEHCGSDGVTYTSMCEIEYEKVCNNKPDLTHVSHGPCKRGRRSGDCNIACPMMYIPVCASNGQTFGNQCAFEAAVECGDVGEDVTVVHEGEC